MQLHSFQIHMVLLAAGLQLEEGNKKKHTASDSEARCPLSLKGAPTAPLRVSALVGLWDSYGPTTYHNLSDYSVESKVCKVDRKSVV